ncbi:hypothetical protein D3C78_702320 [compost metagenome]
MITTMATSSGLSSGILKRAASFLAAKKTTSVNGSDHQILAIIFDFLFALALYVRHAPDVSSSLPPGTPPAC